MKNLSLYLISLLIICNFNKVKSNEFNFFQAALLEPNNDNRFYSKEIQNHAIKLGVRYNF